VDAEADHEFCIVREERPREPTVELMLVALSRSTAR
jgi:hypothetical protein